jgi:ATP-dependent DNA helicase RecG
MGRRERFSTFLARSLREPQPGVVVPASFQQLAARFDVYDQLTPSQRQALVAQCRQQLHQWRQQWRPAQPPGPPRLRLAATDPPSPLSGSRAGPQPLQLDMPLGEVRGVGPKTAARLAQLGLFVVRDLVHYYPRDYLDYANLVRINGLEPGRTATIVATVRRSHAFTSPRNPQLAILELHLSDSTGKLRLSRFFAGRRFTTPGWLKLQQRQFPPGAWVAVSGLVKESGYGPQFQDPLIEVLDGPQAPVQSREIGRLIPVYGLTEGLGAERMRQVMAAVLPLVARFPDPLPEDLRQREGLMERAAALSQIHQPRHQADLKASRQRLVFDEFLLMQLGLLQRRRELRQRPAPSLNPDAAPLLDRFLAMLPFGFTAAQRRVLAEIRADLARPQPMARLVQGDVGSGKTVVAIAALLLALDSGCQGALMAPTEVLAEQHYATLCRWLPQLHVSCALLTGSTRMRRRRELLADLANGQLQLLVGTHALLEDPVQFARLGLVVVDEQHRFGVRQRDRLLHKGLQPHLLTMTATPIPRTLALSVHGDLDVSQIDELPPGRTPIRTQLLSAGERSQAYELIRQEVAAGQRAYVVLPLVEESESSDLQVGLLHGRMASADKQAAIAAFAAGETQVLVSTTVVEVGVDVPEASVMVVEHAERFGLAQLHQLRGRVGRGAAASHCLLIHEGRNPQSRQRLDVLVRSSDGFEIAEMDLRLRGPGQVLGTRQSGLPDLALASLCDDGEVLERARRVAEEILSADPQLQRHPHLARLQQQQRQQLSEAVRLN